MEVSFLKNDDNSDCQASQMSVSYQRRKSLFNVYVIKNMTDLALSKHFAKDNYLYIQMGKLIYL